MKIKFLFLFIIVHQSWYLSAQGGNPGLDGIPRSASDSTNSLAIQPKLIYEFVYSGNILNINEFSDTTLGNGFMFVDPTKKLNQDYVHLGYPGSSSMKLSFETTSLRGFNNGYTQYKIYNQNIDSLRFYRTNRTIADLSFYQLSGNQNNLNANADYSQNFKDDISLSINFKRFNYESQYTNLSNQSTSFAIGFTYFPIDKPFKTYVSFLSNANNESNNGGITDYEALNGELTSIRSNVAVALENSKTRHAVKTIKWHLTRNLLSKNIQASYDLSYNWNRYFFYDKGLLDASDSLIYKSYISDDRGLRYEVNTNVLSNGFFLDAKFKELLNVNVGLVYDLININYGIDTKRRNDLSLVYRGIVTPSKGIDINVNGHLGFGSNAGNFLLNATSEFNWKKYLNFTAGWKSYLKEPTMVESKIILNKEYIYDNEFAKILGTELRGKLSLPTLGLGFGIRQNVENNTIYWNSVGLPIQYGDVYTSTELSANTFHKLWKFGIENKAVYQIFSNNLFNMPRYYTAHNFYFESHLFQRNLQLRIGTNARIIPSSNLQKFNPVVGQFYQGNYNPTLYPEWGFYISGKVSKFRILFEYDNLTDWFTNQVNFNVQDYPYNDANLRFGVRWLLLD